MTDCVTTYTVVDRQAVRVCVSCLSNRYTPRYRLCRGLREMGKNSSFQPKRRPIKLHWASEFDELKQACSISGRDATHSVSVGDESCSDACPLVVQQRLASYIGKSYWSNNAASTAAAGGGVSERGVSRTQVNTAIIAAAAAHRHARLLLPYISIDSRCAI